MNHDVILSVASNKHPRKYLSEARQRLGQVLYITSETRAIWTDPINSPRPDKYLNQLVYAATPLPVEQLLPLLKQIERDMGRTAEEKRQGIVRIDIDLMQYDSVRYHLRDWERDYIKKLL